MPPSPPANSEEPSPDAAAPSPHFGDAPAPPPAPADTPGNSAAAQPGRGGSSAPREPRTALPAAELVLQQRAVAALFVSLLSLAGLMGLNNWQRGAYVALFALVAGVVALWLGVTAMVRARRARMAQPRGALVAVIVGGLGVVISGLLLVTFAVLGRQLTSYGQCLNGANTLSDGQACYTQFHRAVTHEISLLQGTATRG